MMGRPVGLHILPFNKMHARRAFCDARSAYVHLVANDHVKESAPTAPVTYAEDFLLFSRTNLGSFLLLTSRHLEKDYCPHPMKHTVLLLMMGTKLNAFSQNTKPTKQNQNPCVYNMYLSFHSSQNKAFYLL